MNPLEELTCYLEKVDPVLQNSRDCYAKLMYMQLLASAAILSGLERIENQLKTNNNTKGTPT